MTLLSSVSKTEGPLHWLFILPPPPCIPFCMPCIPRLYTFLYPDWLGGLQRYTPPPQSLHCLSETDHQHQHPDLHQILSARHPDCPDWDLAFIRSGKQKHFNNHVKCQTYTPWFGHILVEGVYSYTVGYKYRGSILSPHTSF